MVSSDVIEKEYYIVCSLAVLFSFFTILIGIFLIVLIYQKRRRLHTCRHLLMCNTSVALIFYCVNQAINLIFIGLLPWYTSDISCQWRAYATNVSITAAIYSYLVQSISRSFFILFPMKYPFLITFKAHHILIFIHWLVAFVIPLSTVLTDDIRFIPNSACGIPFQAKLHIALNTLAVYVFPLVSFSIIYIYIYIFK